MSFAPVCFPVLLAAQAFSAFAMTGIIWLVQLVQYPGLARVDARDFAAFHAHHCRAIGFVVGPLMVTELLTGLLLAWCCEPVWFWRGMLAFLSVIWLSTALVQGPLHARLAREGPRSNLVGSLVRGNWLRTVLWTVRSAGLVWFYARGWALS